MPCMMLLMYVNCFAHLRINYLCSSPVMLILILRCVTTYCQVCKAWEGKALEVDKDVRLALIRIGVVLGKDGGALGW